jgi:hypothetical protein
MIKVSHKIEVCDGVDTLTITLAKPGYVSVRAQGHGSGQPMDDGPTPVVEMLLSFDDWLGMVQAVQAQIIDPSDEKHRDH